MGWVTNGWGMRGRRIYKVNSTNFARNEGAKERRASGRTKEEERDKELGQDLQIQTFEFRPLQEKL